MSPNKPLSDEKIILSESIEGGSDINSEPEFPIEIDLNLALDELETNSISLSSDMAAELVTELENISPDLNSSIDESILLESSLSFDENLHLDDDTLHGALSENINELDEEELEKIEIDKVELDIAVDTIDLEEPKVEHQLTADEVNVEELDTYGLNAHEFNIASVNEQLMDESVVKKNNPLSAILEVENEKVHVDELDLDMSITEVELSMDAEFDSSEEFTVEEEIITESIISEPLIEDFIVEVENISLPKGEFEAIDFSSSSIPMLESARETNQELLGAHYNIGDEEPILSNDDVSLASEKEYKESQLENERAHQDLVNDVEVDDNGLAMESMSNVKTLAELAAQEEKLEKLAQSEQNKNIELESMLGELSFENENENENENEEEETFGKAEFLTDEDEIVVEEKVSIIEESIERAGLALESIEESKISGKAIFYEEEVEDESNAEEKNSIIDDSAEQGCLSLENIEGEKITGRAVFIDEEDDSDISTETSSLVSDSDFDDGGLTLEFDSDINTSGKAQFVIDDEPLENELEHTSIVDDGDNVETENIENIKNSFNDVVDNLTENEEKNLLGDDGSLDDENLLSEHNDLDFETPLTEDFIEPESVSSNSEEYQIEQTDFSLNELEFDNALENMGCYT